MKIQTDWDAYYRRPYKTAAITRRIGTNALIYFIKKCVLQNNPTIVELGGANSCFYDAIQKEIRPSMYTVVDNNSYGLSLFAQRVKGYKVKLVQGDVLAPIKIEKADVVFSVGLVEHFSKRDTKRAIESHFSCVKSKGLVIIAFPTPTWLYKAVRKCAEVFGMWNFPDERPIDKQEALSIVEKYADIIEYKIIWGTVLTQAYVVLRSKK